MSRAKGVGVQPDRIVVREGPVPVFSPETVRTAVRFQRDRGKLQRLRKLGRRGPSRAPEAEYFRGLRTLLAELQGLLGPLVIDRLPAIVQDTPVELRARKDAGEVLVEAIGELRVAFAGRAPLESLARRAGNAAESADGKDQGRMVQTVLGIRPELGEPWLESEINKFVRENAKHVGKVTDDFIDRLETRISRRVSEGFRAEDIAKELTRDFVKNEGLEVKRARKRAKLIARDQVGSFQGQLAKVRQQRIGVERYVWRTSQDERVRRSHIERDGEIFEWGRPIEEQLEEKGLTVDTIDGHPGLPINCRCYGEPVLSDLLDE